MNIITKNRIKIICAFTLGAGVTYISKYFTSKPRNNDSFSNRDICNIIDSKYEKPVHDYMVKTWNEHKNQVDSTTEMLGVLKMGANIIFADKIKDDIIKLCGNDFDCEVAYAISLFLISGYAAKVFTEIK